MSSLGADKLRPPTGHEHESIWYTRISRLFPATQEPTIEEGIDDYKDDEFSLPNVISRTKLIYDELQTRRRQIVESFETIRLPEGGLPPINNHDFEEATARPTGSRDKMTVPSVVEFMRARNRWLKNKPNLRDVTEGFVINELRKEKKTFMTQVDGQTKSSQRSSSRTPSYSTRSSRRFSSRKNSLLPPGYRGNWSRRRTTHPQADIRQTHYFWSTVPSSVSQSTDLKLTNFINGTLNVVTAYTKERESMDRFASRLVMSAESNTPLVHSMLLKVKAKPKPKPQRKITPGCIAKNIDDFNKMFKIREAKDTFDPAEYKRDATRAGGLSNHVKNILRQDSKRSEHQIRDINEAMTRLHCFDNMIHAGPLITSNVIRELSKTVTLHKYDKGRVVIKQGHNPEAFYFIVAGTVGVYKTERDKNGTVWTRHIQSLGQGKTFGEIAFFPSDSKQQKRTATIITSSECELLRINKDAFEEILLGAKQQEWAERLQFMQQIPTLSEVTESELQSLNESARLDSFEDGAIIVGDTKGHQECVRFVYMGECLLVHELYLKKTKELRLQGYVVEDCLNPPSQYDMATKEDRMILDSSGRRTAKPGILKRRFIKVHSLQPHHFFGAGEDLTDLYVIASSRVVCLTIPTVEFILKPGLRKILHDMTDSLKEATPSKSELFQKYKVERNWKQYKKKLLNDVKANKKLKKANCWPYKRVTRD